MTSYWEQGWHRTAWKWLNALFVFCITKGSRLAGTNYKGIDQLWLSWDCVHRLKTTARPSRATGRTWLQDDILPRCGNDANSGKWYFVSEQDGMRCDCDLCGWVPSECTLWGVFEGPEKRYKFDVIHSFKVGKRHVQMYSSVTLDPVKQRQPVCVKILQDNSTHCHRTWQQKYRAHSLAANVEAVRDTEGLWRGPKGQVVLPTGEDVEKS